MKNISVSSRKQQIKKMNAYVRYAKQYFFKGVAGSKSGVAP